MIYDFGCRLRCYSAMMCFFILIPVIPAFSSPAAQDSSALTPAAEYTVTKTDSPVRIDGILDDEVWTRAEAIPLLYEWFPGDNIAPPVETICLIAYDKHNLYVAIRAFDPDPSQIRAHLMDRDAIDTFVQDDHISLLFDTFNDERRAFQFRVNPLGVQADAFFSELEGYEDFSWDAIWNSAGRITETGYEVEIAIPFNQLRFPKTDQPQIWGFDAGRSYPRSERHRIGTSYRDRDRNCLLCQENKLHGIQGISPGRNLEFDPTITLDRTDVVDAFPDGSLKTGDVEFEPGITAKWGITPNMILNTTVNPDFSQVEADVAQLDVNTRYALYYPEKRPFFLEGADFFLTPMQAVFTRTVVDPDWGVKLTGKAGANAIGVFAAQDPINNLLFPSNEGSGSDSRDFDVTSGVVRYRRDVGSGSTLGLLYTSRFGDGYENQLAGIDGFLRFSRAKTLQFQYIHTATDYPALIALDNAQSSKRFQGDGWNLAMTHVSRNVNYAIIYNDLSPGFRADYGYIPRTDYRQVTALVTPILWGQPGGWFNQWTFTLRGSATWDHDGELTDQVLNFGETFQGPLQTFHMANFYVLKERYGGVLYDLMNGGVYFEIQPWGGLKLSVMSHFGDRLDYRNFRKSSRLNAVPSIELGLGKRVNLNFNHTWERLDYKGDRVYTANLSQLRLVYHLNLRTFLRATIQYQTVTNDPDLFIAAVSGKEEALFTQLLFSYKINPQTVLFLGYSDNHLGMDEVNLMQTDRTFFLKIGYALVI